MARRAARKSLSLSRLLSSPKLNKNRYRHRRKASDLARHHKFCSGHQAKVRISCAPPLRQVWI
jgi:hypothetical protein